MTVEEAVRACTAGAAASYFADDRLGTLEPGKLADVVVLDGTCYDAGRSELGEIAVDVTILGGEIAYSSGRLEGLGRRARSATSDSIS